jgi:hypothetical protein
MTEKRTVWVNVYEESDRDTFHRSEREAGLASLVNNQRYPPRVTVLEIEYDAPEVGDE